MNFSKTMFAVAAGILIAAAVLGCFYYFTIEVPRDRAARVAAGHDLFRMYLEDSNSSAAAIEEQRLRDSAPSSPCNSLTGEEFASCVELGDVNLYKDSLRSTAKK